MKTRMIRSEGLNVLIRATDRKLRRLTGEPIETSTTPTGVRWAITQSGGAICEIELRLSYHGLWLEQAVIIHPESGASELLVETTRTRLANWTDYEVVDAIVDKVVLLRRKLRLRARPPQPRTGLIRDEPVLASMAA